MKVSELQNLKKNLVSEVVRGLWKARSCTYVGHRRIGHIHT
jgi:hypothetical protein